MTWLKAIAFSNDAKAERELLSKEILGSVLKVMFVCFCFCMETNTLLQGFSKLALSAFLDWIILFFFFNYKSISVHCRILSSILGLYPRDTDTKSLLYLWWSRMFSDTIQRPLGTKCTFFPLLKQRRGSRKFRDHKSRSESN